VAGDTGFKPGEELIGRIKGFENRFFFVVKEIVYLEFKL